MQIKRIIKKVLPKNLFDYLRKSVYPEKINILEDRLNSLFLTHYRGLAVPNLSQKMVFKNAEFKIHTKHGTDGILAYIFSKIGVTNRTFVEMGVENGRECNTANLSLNFGWQGLLVDVNEEWIRSAKAWYDEKLGSLSNRVKIIASFITAENINQLLKDNGLSGEIDLLSVDIDGNDYWVWQAINIINPRVVVLEYNPAFGHKSISIKYDPNHRYQPQEKHPLYFGASLVALAKLAQKKGYLLVACDSHGQDAFFIKKEVAEGKFIELSPAEAFYSNPLHVVLFGVVGGQFFEQIRHLDFEDI